MSPAVGGGHLLAASQVQPLTSSAHGSPLLVREGSAPSSPPTHQLVSQRVSATSPPQPLNTGSQSAIKMADPLPPLSLVNAVGMKIAEESLPTSVTTPNSPYPIQQGRYPDLFGPVIGPQYSDPHWIVIQWNS